MSTGIERGDIWLVELDPTIGHEIRKTRPAVIVQNDVFNAYSHLTIIAPITSQKVDVVHPIQAFIPKTAGVRRPSKALLSQIRCVDKRRLIKRLGKADAETKKEIDEALRISLGLVEI